MIKRVNIRKRQTRDNCTIKVGRKLYVISLSREQVSTEENYYDISTIFRRVILVRHANIKRNKLTRSMSFAFTTIIQVVSEEPLENIPWNIRNSKLVLVIESRG